MLQYLKSIVLISYIYITTPNSSSQSQIHYLIWDNSRIYTYTRICYKIWNNKWVNWAIYSLSKQNYNNNISLVLQFFFSFTAQPPGIPEICKKSLTSCPCTGGLELFILGKNFLKDTRIVFQLDNEDLSSSLEPHWECTVLPDKEFLQQAHLVCVVPPYRRQDLAPTETINLKLYAVSSGKTSEPHSFMYTAASSAPEPSIGKIETTNTTLACTTSDNQMTTTTPAVTTMSRSVTNSCMFCFQ